MEQSPTFVGQIARAAAQLDIRRPAKTIAEHLAIGSDEGAGPTLAHPQHLPQVSDSITFGGGPYHCFVRSYFSAAQSEHRFRQQLLQLPVLVLQIPQPLGVRDLHATILGLPVVQRGLRDAVLASQIGGLRTRLMLSQPRIICCSVNLFRFIIRPPSSDRTLTPRVGKTQWQVSCIRAKPINETAASQSQVASDKGAGGYLRIH